jgi:hypothetical protein
MVPTAILVAVTGRISVVGQFEIISWYLTFDVLLAFMCHASKIILAAAFLIVTAIVVLAAWRLRSQEKISAASSTRLIGMAFIVGAATYLVAMGQGEGTGFAAIIGLLGTALGYLFAKDKDGAPPPPSS